MFNTSSNAYFAVYGFTILREISKGTFEASHKIFNPYTAKYTPNWLEFFVTNGIF